MGEARAGWEVWSHVSPPGAAGDGGHRWPLGARASSSGGMATAPVMPTLESFFGELGSTQRAQKRMCTVPVSPTYYEAPGIERSERRFSTVHGGQISPMDDGEGEQRSTHVTSVVTSGTQRDSFLSRPTFESFASGPRFTDVPPRHSETSSGLGDLPFERKSGRSTGFRASGFGPLTSSGLEERTSKNSAFNSQTSHKTGSSGAFQDDEMLEELRNTDSPALSAHSDGSADAEARRKQIDRTPFGQHPMDIPESPAHEGGSCSSTSSAHGSRHVAMPPKEARDNHRPQPTSWQHRFASMASTKHFEGQDGAGSRLVPGHPSESRTISRDFDLSDLLPTARDRVTRGLVASSHEGMPMVQQNSARTLSSVEFPQFLDEVSSFDDTKEAAGGAARSGAAPPMRNYRQLRALAQPGATQNNEDLIFEQGREHEAQGSLAGGGSSFDDYISERPTMMVEKASLKDTEMDELISVSRQRKTAIMTSREHTMSHTTDKRLAQRYAMLHDMVNLVGSQLDPERRGANSMLELMTSLRLYTQETISCDRCSLFIKAKKGNKFVLWTMLETGQEIAIPLLSGLAGAAVASRGAVRVRDARKDNRWNNEVDKFTGYSTMSVLCVPVFAGNEEEVQERYRNSYGGLESGQQQPVKHEDILGVLQVINKIGTRTDVYGKEEAVGCVAFTHDDETVLKSLATMSAITLQVHKALESERRSKDRFAALGAMAKMLLRQSTADVKSLYRHIQSEAARLCHCERAFIYMLDPSKTHMQVEPTLGQQLSLRLPPQWAGSGSGKLGMNFIAGHCVRTGAPISVTDVMTDPKWCSSIEQRRLGLEELHSVIALPIETEGIDGTREVIGVLQAVNKTDAKGRSVDFDAEDSELLEGLCGYTASALSTSMAFKATAASYKTVELAIAPPSEVLPSKPKSKGNITFSIAQEDSAICMDDFSIVTELLAGTQILDWDFDSSFMQNADLSRLIHPVFSAFDLQVDFRISDSTLTAFAQQVSQGYFKNPFHNYAHAWSVFQACTHMLYTLQGAANTFLCRVDVLSLLVGALCHDIGHPGTNNMFQQKICSDIALLYNDVSILENHHAATCFKVMVDTPEANVLRSLSKKEFRNARRFICHGILSTDMSRHERELTLLRAHLNTPFTKDSEDDRQLAVASLLHAADLSNPCREPALAERWARLLAEEFRLQAKKEEETGVEVSTFMLGGYKAGNEIFFIQTFVKPLWDTMALWNPPFKFYLQQLTNHLDLLQKRTQAKEDNDDRDEEKMIENRSTFHPGDFKNGRSTKSMPTQRSQPRSDLPSIHGDGPVSRFARQKRASLQVPQAADVGPRAGRDSGAGRFDDDDVGSFAARGSGPARFDDDDGDQLLISGRMRGEDSSSSNTSHDGISSANTFASARPRLRKPSSIDSLPPL
mmetsp:Transcript_151976/g.487878  ORF Transcript_151976/g.487878 Transcript_151976/m.487878 type:complete len:1408 (-) Transcript_151976:130-4353(-)